MASGRRLHFGLDFGNTNTSLAWRDVHKNLDGKPSLVCLDPDQSGIQQYVLPSAVLFPFGGKEPVVGRSVRMKGSSAGLRFFNYKQELIAESESKAKRRGGLSRTSQDALTAVLDFLRQTAARSGDLINDFQAGPDGRRVPADTLTMTVGIPAETDEVYRKRLSEALVASGWFPDRETQEKHLSFLAEPVAVALNVPQTGRSTFMVYDHGGATLDIATVSSGGQSSKAVVQSKKRITALGTVPQNVGGSYLDRLLLRHLVHQNDDMETWQSLIASAYGEEFDMAGLRRLVDMSAAEAESAEARVYERLCLDAEQVRIRLSDNDEVFFMLAWGTASERKLGIMVTRDQLDESIETVRRAIRDQLPTPEPNTMYVMAGGCSKTPAFIGDISQRYGKTNTISFSDVSPLTAIATGLAYNFRGGVGPDIIDKLDTDYGIWNDRDGLWDVVLKSGTRYEETRLPPAGPGISRSYRPYPTTKEITIRVGQQVQGAWKVLGQRDLTLRTPSTRFRVFFGIEPERGILQIRLEETETGQLIQVENPDFPSTSR